MTELDDKLKILQALQKGEITLQGQFLNSSNYTFLGNLAYDDLAFEIVYKPTRGEQPLWDFPTGTLSKREVAAYLVSETLHWNIVPPTVYRRQKAPLGPGSLQQYIEHDPEYHYFRFDEEDKQRLRPVVLFDLLINNADRKGGHILSNRKGGIWLIDHGICFHEEPKLRTVIWDFAGEEIPENLITDLTCLTTDLERKTEIFQQLNELLHPNEINAMLRRTRQLLDSGHFPYPAGSRRPYPWPPI
jgi:hypothetical protein